MYVLKYTSINIEHVEIKRRKAKIKDELRTYLVTYKL